MSWCSWIVVVVVVVSSWRHHWLLGSRTINWRSFLFIHTSFRPCLTFIHEEHVNNYLTNYEVLSTSYAGPLTEIFSLEYFILPRNIEMRTRCLLIFHSIEFSRADPPWRSLVPNICPAPPFFLLSLLISKVFLLHESQITEVHFSSRPCNKGHCFPAPMFVLLFFCFRFLIIILLR